VDLPDGRLKLVGFRHPSLPHQTLEEIEDLCMTQLAVREGQPAGKVDPGGHNPQIEVVIPANFQWTVVGGGPDFPANSLWEAAVAGIALFAAFQYLVFFYFSVHLSLITCFTMDATPIPNSHRAIRRMHNPIAVPTKAITF
jgi:hypothetical protein